jgi:ATP-dependent Clp protease ATP-binding subunit ClpC
MFEKYTEKARRAIFFARCEVSQLGGLAIGPEHLLLGLLRADQSLIPRLLGERDEPVRQAIRQRIEEHSRAGKMISTIAEWDSNRMISTSVGIPLSAEAKAALRYGEEEAERMRHRQMGTEHLLLGVIRVEGSFAAGVLREQGIGYDEVREAVERMSGE